MEINRWSLLVIRNFENTQIGAKRFYIIMIMIMIMIMIIIIISIINAI